METKKEILTPKLAQKMQDDIFRKMTAEQKIMMVGQLFKLGKTLNALNNRKKDGSHRIPGKSS